MDWYFPWSNLVWIVLKLLIVQHAIFVASKISVVISVSPLKQYPTRVNTIKGDNLINIKNPISYNRPRGPTDKASDYESGDSRFESWRGRSFTFLSCIVKKAATVTVYKIGYTAISRKVVGKSTRDNAERYCGWFSVHCHQRNLQEWN